MSTRIDLAKGEDRLLAFRVSTGDTVQLSDAAAAAATSLSIKANKTALSSGDKLLFSDNVVLTLSGSVAAGAVTASVSALPGPLARGDVGKLIQDITGFTLQFEVLTRAGDATPLIAKNATISDATGGVCRVQIDADDSDDLDPGSYYWALWRRDSGDSRPIAEGTLALREGGFL